MNTDHRKSNTLSFLFSRLEKAFTRVVSSLILAFKSLMSSAGLFYCLLARLCFEALKLALLVADRILFSACSRLAWSGIMVVNFCLRESMASVSALTFFSCCWIISWRKSCSARSQGRNGNRSFRLQVVSPTSRFPYIEVVSPTRPKSFRLHDLSRFAYIEVDSPTLNTYY